MRTHFLPSGHPKSDLDEVPEVMFEVGEWPRELIICLLDVLIREFDVVEAMFQGDERSCKSFLYFQVIEKTTWRKSLT
jgi:hypothetical protein